MTAEQRDAEELERLRHYRNQREAEIRAVPAGRTFERFDAEYMEILASYGGRMVRAAWLYEMGRRIEATLDECDRLRWIEKHGCTVEEDGGRWRVLVPYVVGPDVEYHAFAADTLAEAIEAARSGGAA